MFLLKVVQSLNKHFKKWVDSPLLVYALFSEAATGKIIAHLLVGELYLGNEEFLSKEHGTTIKLMSLYDFVNTKCSIDNIKEILNLPFVKENLLKISAIKENSDIWSSTHNNSALRRFQNLFLERLAALPSNSQFCEQGVKESSQDSWKTLIKRL